MIRHLLRPIHGISLLICLVLAACSGQPEKPVTNNATPVPEANAKVLRQRVAELHQRVSRIDAQIALLHEEHLKQYAALTSETESLANAIAAMEGQLGGKSPALAARPATTPGKSVMPATSPAGTEAGKGPLGPLARVLLILIILFAIWIFVRIFLGRWAEEEDDDDELGVDAADEEPGSDEAPLHRLDPEVRAPSERPDETPRGGAANERDEPKA